jgi:hypothetical protein
VIDGRKKTSLAGNQTPVSQSVAIHVTEIIFQVHFDITHVHVCVYLSTTIHFIKLADFHTLDVKFHPFGDIQHSLFSVLYHQQ